LSGHRVLHGIKDCEIVRVTISLLGLRRNYEAKWIPVQQVLAIADEEEPPTGN
jgi:hypothetical protein